MSKAVLVVDIQKDYFPGGKFPLVNQEEAAQVASKIIADARAKSVPVIFIQHLSADPTAIPFFIPETDGAEIADAVKPLENEEVIKKFYPNSFRDTTLKASLDKLGQPADVELIIIGSMAQMCIEATTRHAADAGYKCVVIKDACASPDQEYDNIKISGQQVHAVAMNALAFGYAKVVKADEYLA